MFIVIEGLDGSGKSTQIKLMRDFLSNIHVPFEYLHFPRTDSPIFGDLIARFLRGEFGSNEQVNPYLVALLYAGDRNDAAPIIQSWINQKKLVIVDRYVISNIAYQCAKLQSISEKQQLKEWILNLEYQYYKIPQPDLNIFLDAPIRFVKKNLENQRIGQDRGYLKGAHDIHEKDLRFQEQVREMYLWLAKSEPNMQVITCYQDEQMLPTDVIFQQLVNILKEKKIIN